MRRPPNLALSGISRRLVRASWLSACLILSGCQGDNFGPKVNEAEAYQVLVDLLNSRLDTFEAAAQVLQTEVMAWEESAAAPPSSAETAWTNAMHSWQTVYALGIPPADDFFGTAKRIYNHGPKNTHCRVKYAIGHWDLEDMDLSKSQYTYFVGLSSLEYLIFGFQNDECSSRINERFSELTIEEQDRQKRALAQALIDLLLEDLADIRTLLNQSYLGVLGSSQTVSSESNYTEHVVWGLHFSEYIIQRRKLEDVLFVQDPDCTYNCGPNVESRMARMSGRWLGLNLKAQQELFTGADGVGMDDHLASIGQFGLRDRILAAFENTLKRAATIQDDLIKQLEADPSKIRALYGEVLILNQLLNRELNEALGRSPINWHGHED